MHVEQTVINLPARVVRPVVWPAGTSAEEVKPAEMLVHIRALIGDEYLLVGTLRLRQSFLEVGG